MDSKHQESQSDSDADFDSDADADPTSDPFDPKSFSAASSSRDAPSSASDRSPFEGEEGAPSFGGDSMAVEMARLWVRDHQTASMLGAFAVGVFVGALLRD